MTVNYIFSVHFLTFSFFNRNISSQILEHLDMDQDNLILDLGCGPGTWIMVIIKRYLVIKLQ
jgi:cyclopropane fatty-acyl-phospholipid synthase-like methyltransferase